MDKALLTGGPISSGKQNNVTALMGTSIHFNVRVRYYSCEAPAAFVSSIWAAAAVLVSHAALLSAA